MNLTWSRCDDDNNTYDDDDDDDDDDDNYHSVDDVNYNNGDDDDDDYCHNHRYSLACMYIYTFYLGCDWFLYSSFSRWRE